MCLQLPQPLELECKKCQSSAPGWEDGISLYSWRIILDIKQKNAENGTSEPMITRGFTQHAYDLWVNIMLTSHFYGRNRWNHTQAVREHTLIEGFNCHEPAFLQAFLTSRSTLWRLRAACCVLRECCVPHSGSGEDVSLNPYLGAYRTFTQDIHLSLIIYTIYIFLYIFIILYLHVQPVQESWVASVSQQKSPSELDQPMIACDWLWLVEKLNPNPKPAENWVYPLVNCYITMENHHFQWENPL